MSRKCIGRKWTNRWRFGPFTFCTPALHWGIWSAMPFGWRLLCSIDSHCMRSPKPFATDKEGGGYITISRKPLEKNHLIRADFTLAQFGRNLPFLGAKKAYPTHCQPFGSCLSLRFLFVGWMKQHFSIRHDRALSTFGRPGSTFAQHLETRKWNHWAPGTIWPCTQCYFQHPISFWRISPHSLLFCLWQCLWHGWHNHLNSPLSFSASLSVGERGESMCLLLCMTTRERKSNCNTPSPIETLGLNFFKSPTLWIGGPHEPTYFDIGVARNWTHPWVSFSWALICTVPLAKFLSHPCNLTHVCTVGMFFCTRKKCMLFNDFFFK